MSTKKILVCARCGGKNIVVDAYVAWNVDTQDFELVATYDKGAHCENCGGECRYDFVAIEEDINSAPSVHLLAVIARAVKAAATAADLMDGCPDDDVMEAASVELSEAGAALATVRPPIAELIELQEQLTAAFENVMLHHGHAMPAEDQRTRQALIATSRALRARIGGDA